MASRVFSAVGKPSFTARLASKLRGQPSTMPMMNGSGSRLIRPATFSPATRFSAAISSPTVAERPGMVRLRRAPAAALCMVAAWIKKPTAERGEACQWRTSSDTGSTASLPASGSRRVFGQNPDAALVGRPGRVQDADAVHKTAARIIGQQQFADRLLGAVAEQRRMEEFIADGLGKRRAEHRDRRGEHHAGLVTAADQPDGVEQHPRAIEIDT